MTNEANGWATDEDATSVGADGSQGVRPVDVPAFAVAAREAEKAGNLSTAETLAREAGNGRAARLWQARYRAIAGDHEAVQALLGDPREITGCSCDEAVLAIHALDVEASFERWLVAAEYYVAIVSAPGTKLHRRHDRLVIARLTRIGSFFVLSEEGRRRAANLLAKATGKRVLPFLSYDRRIKNFVCFAATRPEITYAPSLIADLAARSSKEIVASWDGKILKLHKAGRASDEELAAYASQLTMDKRLAIVAGRFIDTRAHGALRTLVLARPEATERAIDRWAGERITAGRAWQVEHDLHVLRAAGCGTSLGRAARRSADSLGDPGLSLARAVAPLTGAPRDCVAAAGRLSGAGYRLEALELLDRVRGSSEPAAWAWAKASSGGAEADAGAAWEQAHAASPSRRIRNRLATTRAESDGAYDEAVALLHRSLEEKPGDYDSLLRLAEVHALAGERTRCKAVLDELVIAFPGDHEVDVQHLRFLMAGGEIEQVHERAAELAASGSIPAIRLMAELHLIHARNTESTDAWRTAADADGGAYLSYRYVVALFQENRFDDALAELRRLIVRHPGYWRLHLKLGQALERLDEYGDALASFTRAAALEPAAIEPAAGVARCLAYLGRADDCSVWLDRIGRPRIDFAWVHSLRAFNFAMNGHSDRVAEALAPIYVLCKEFCERRETIRRTDPATVWLRGRFVTHENRSAAQTNTVFERTLRTLRDAKALAIVGNSPLLLGAGRGAAIDAHDAVIRINDFETYGYEADVGTRTSLWYSAATRTARPRAGMREAVPTWIYQDKSYQLPSLEGYSRLRLGDSLSAEQSSFLPPDFHHLSARLITPRPTSGLRIIGLLEFFVQRPLEIYGFDLFTTDRLHYFEEHNRNLHLSEFHAVRFERDFIEKVLTRASFTRRGDR